jgi:hypothetical protein
MEVSDQCAEILLLLDFFLSSFGFFSLFFWFPYDPLGFISSHSELDWEKIFDIIVVVKL